MEKKTLLNTRSKRASRKSTVVKLSPIEVYLLHFSKEFSTTILVSCSWLWCRVISKRTCGGLIKFMFSRCVSVVPHHSTCVLWYVDGVAIEDCVLSCHPYNIFKVTIDNYIGMPNLASLLLTILWMPLKMGKRCERTGEGSCGVARGDLCVDSLFTIILILDNLISEWVPKFVGIERVQGHDIPPTSTKLTRRKKG